MVTTTTSPPTSGASSPAAPIDGQAICPDAPPRSDRRPPSAARQRVGRGRRGEEGYNLVMLVVAFTILNILVAIALPRWSYIIRREREEETIHRGLQYAEAIRVFRQRFGRYPATLEELVKVKPRSIRQLWTEPLTEDGEFGLVIEAPQAPAQAPGGRPQPGQPGQPGQPAAPGQPVSLPQTPGGPANAFGGFGIGGSGRVTAPLIKLPRVTGKGQKLITTGPMAIHGVYLAREGDALRKFLGQDKYEQWVFVAELITPPVTAPGRPLPRVGDDLLGRSFPDGLSPALGAGGGPAVGQPVAPGSPLGGKGQPPPTREQDADGEPSFEPDPDAPPDFPEDFPVEPPDDTMMEEAPPPEEVFPEDFPEPEPEESEPEVDESSR